MALHMIQTPECMPQYAVIFSSTQSTDNADYSVVANRIAERVASMPGFIRMESVHDSERNGITVCYWDSMEAIDAWKQDLEHHQAQEQGKARWYERYEVVVTKVEYAYSSEKEKD